MGCLHDDTLLLLLLPGDQRGSSGVLKDFANTFVSLGRTLEIFDGADLLADVLGLWRILASDDVTNQLKERHIPARVSLASAKFCAALQSSFDHISNLVYSPQGQLVVLDRSARLRKSTASRVRHIKYSIKPVLTFSCTLSSESGESTAKQMRMTCESG